jgi:hypothetical protein
VFDARLAAARRADLPAVVVYTDIWRSNRVRHFSNFMPYWNRAFLVIPRDEPPTLLCGLSPRVYPWIRSVTILENILPSPSLAGRLLQLCSERSWTRIGALNFTQFPHDLYSALGTIEVVDLPLEISPDHAELAMHRHAAEMARGILAEELPNGIGRVDHEFTGRLERRFRRAGAEDLVILLTTGATPPLPPKGATLTENFSVSLALEYRGHWVKVLRNAARQTGSLPGNAYTETLAGPYPYEAGTGPLFAARWEIAHQRGRVFYGETYRTTPAGAELL